MNSVWYTVCQKTYYDWHDRLLTIIYQAIPSMIMDLFIASSKFKLTRIVRKMLVMAEVIKFFIHNQFEFANENLFDVINRYVRKIMSSNHYLFVVYRNKAENLICVFFIWF